MNSLTTPHADTPHAARRARLMQHIGQDAALILVNPPPRRRSHDTYHSYRADSDFYYLTGFTEAESILVLTPGHDQGDFHLFVPPRDPLKEQWDGIRLGPVGAELELGADQGHDLDDFASRLPELLAHRKALYHSPGTQKRADQIIKKTLRVMRQTRNKFAYAPSELHDPSSLLQGMRAIKDEDELGRLRRSCAIAAEAHERAMRATRANMTEYQLQALIEYVFKARGAAAPAYESVVAGGARANILHYIENDATLRDGEMVLVDAGCEYRYYASDITRTWPVNGAFSPAQRDLYQAVLTLQQELIDLCASHPSFEEVSRHNTRRSVEILKDLGVLEGDTDQLIESGSHKRYAPHGFGHWLGLDVHDTAPYHDAQGSVRLSPGHVLTIEPGIYIPLDSEHVPVELRGQGVRIEDDVLITAQGVDVLTVACPKNPDTIESIVGTEPAPF